jgi:hypothetical protein
MGSSFFSNYSLFYLGSMTINKEKRFTLFR